MMHNELDSVASPVGVDQLLVDGPRRPRVVPLLTTTALLVSIEPNPARCVNLHRVGSFVDFREVLERRLDDFVTPAAFDLIGHSTRDYHLRRLGDTLIDMLDHRVVRFFRALAQGCLGGAA